MKYIAKPVEVEAARISEIISMMPNGDVRMLLDDNSTFTADASMLSRMTPKVGDYVVTQADGYVYLNPSAVFQRKYRAFEDSEAVRLRLGVGEDDRVLECPECGTPVVFREVSR